MAGMLMPTFWDFGVCRRAVMPSFRQIVVMVVVLVICHPVQLFMPIEDGTERTPLTQGTNQPCAVRSLGAWKRARDTLTYLLIIYFFI